MRPLILLIVTLLISPFTPAPVSAQSSGVTPPRTKCNIRIDDPHLSQYLIRNEGILATKVNARSICDKAMTDLVFTVELFKVGFLRNYRVDEKEVVVRGLIPANKVIWNRETHSECKNRRKSKYFAKAHAQAMIDGVRVKTLPVLTARTVTLDCGS